MSLSACSPVKLAIISPCSCLIRSSDQDIRLSSVIADLPDTVVTQGNLDPLCLIDGGQNMFSQIDDIIEATKGRRHIFNLGHGITQHTPPHHVSELVDYIRNKG